MSDEFERPRSPDRQPPPSGQRPSRRDEQADTRWIGVFALVALIVTVLWLLFLVSGLARSGTITTFDEALAYGSHPDALYQLTYLNAALTVVAVTFLFAGLYAHYRRRYPVGAIAGLLFVPVYAALNLAVYLSQLSAVPLLVALRADPAYQPAADAGLHLLIQAWPGSAAAFFNSLAYALLGIPSIVYGAMLARRDGLRRASGVLLVLNGVACGVGFLGLLAGNVFLSGGTVLGGVLFLAALVPLSFAFLRR